MGAVPLRIVQILQGAAVTPVETGGAAEWIDDRGALAQGVVGKKCPTVFPIFVFGDIEDFFTIFALVGELFLGAVWVGDEGWAVERIVIIGEGVAAGAGFCSNTSVKIIRVAGDV